MKTTCTLSLCASLLIGATGSTLSAGDYSAPSDSPLYGLEKARYRSYDRAVARIEDPMRTPATTGNDPRPMDPSASERARNNVSSATMNQGAVFMSADKMRSTEIFNANHEAAGTIKDAVIDRGSGRITHLVVATNAKMNMNSRTLLIPYAAFSWDEARKHLMFSAPLNNASDPSMNASSWTEWNKDNWTATNQRDRNNLASSLPSNYFRRNDTDRLSTSGEPRKLKGNVEQITRQDSGDGQESTVITVVTDGREEQIVVGPSWYLAGNSVTLFRGSPVDLYVVQQDVAGEKRLVARSMGSGNDRVDMYDREGWPTWYGGDASGVVDPRPTDPNRNMDPNRATNPTTPDRGMNTSRAYNFSPLVLATELDGRKLNCRNDVCGTVDDLIIECKSGRIAFVSIDPDTNFLGIGDTKRLIPWGVVTAGADSRMWLDIDRAMVTSAPEIPKDWEIFSRDGTYKRVYSSADVAEMDFNSNMNYDRNRNQDRNRNNNSNPADNRMDPTRK